MFGDNPRICKPQQDKTNKNVCAQWRLRLAWAFVQFHGLVRVFAVAWRNPRSLPTITISQSFLAEKTFGEKSDYYFSPRNISFRAKGRSAAKRLKRFVFLGLICRSNKMYRHCSQCLSVLLIKPIFLKCFKSAHTGSSNIRYLLSNDVKIIEKYRKEIRAINMSFMVILFLISLLNDKRVRIHTERGPIADNPNMKTVAISVIFGQIKSGGPEL